MGSKSRRAAKIRRGIRKAAARGYRRSETRAGPVTIRYTGEPKPPPTKPEKVHRPSDYRAYIKSPEWAAKRSEYWGTYGYSCKAVGCTATKDLNVHHHTYARLGAELLSDLVGLCRPHHEAVHKAHDAGGRRESLTTVTGRVTGLWTA